MKGTRASKGPRRSGPPSLSSPPPQELPFGAEILGVVASALRLRDVRIGSGTVSRATVQRLARGVPAVSAEKRTELIERVIDALFTEQYLTERGLSEEEATTHQRLVVEAVEALVSRCDGMVGFFNQQGPLLRSPLTVGLLAQDVLLDVDLRCAAYLGLHGRMHRILGVSGAWASGPGIKSCLDGLRARARETASDQRIYERASLSKNTFRELKEGRSLPQDDTVEKLAYALETFDIGIGPGERETAPEIELELRAACAVAALRSWARDHHHVAVMFDAHVTNVRVLRSDLRRYAQVELAEILASGTAAQQSPEIAARLKQATFEAVTNGMIADAARRQRDFAEMETNGETALQRQVDEMEAMVRYLREQGASLPGWERKRNDDRALVMEQMARLLRFLADEHRIGPAPPFPELERIVGAEAQARDLCDLAALPWTGATREQREALLWEAVETYPGSSEVRTLIGMFLLDDPAQYDQAIYQLETAIMLDEENHDARLSLAGALYGRKLFAKALAHFDVLEARSPPLAPIANLRGACLLELDRPVEAERSYERALEVQPRFVPALRGKARCRRSAGDEDAARKLERDAAFYESGNLPPAR